MTRPLVDVFGDIVTATKDAVLPYLMTLENADGINLGIQTLHYEHGHQSEIIETLLSMNAAGQERQKQKYPMVWLREDISESVGLDNATAGTWRPPAIFIFAQTKKVSKSKDRYENVIEPIVIPIYEELLNQMAKSKYFYAYSGASIRHTKIIHPFWGLEGLYGNKENKLEDPLDCIEIRALELPIKRQSACLTNQPFKNF